MNTLVQDIRYALRGIGRKPGFALMIVLTLALGIGANTAIVSVVKGVLLSPLPYPEPDQLVMVFNKYAESGLLKASSSVPDYYDRVDRNKTLQNLAAFTPRNMDITGDGVPVRVQGWAATASFLPTLGVSPVLGRVFSVDEDQPGKSDVVVISHGLWQRQFGGDPEVIGRSIRLNGIDSEVIGVMPERFKSPTFFGLPADLWTPIAFSQQQKDDGQRGNEFLGVIGRMKSGASIEQVRAEMDVIAASVIDRFADRREFLTNSRWGATVVSLHDETVGDVRPALLVLLGAVALLLLIACANVANLLLARATAREREVAVRVAIGASRARLLRQFLTESMLLSLLGGTAAVLMLMWASDLMVAMLPDSLPRQGQISIDGAVLLFAFALSAVTGLVFGTAPAWLLSGDGLSASLKEGGRGVASGARRKLRSGLVVAEVALSLVLLVGAGLLLKSFVRLLEDRPGFQPENRLVARIALPPSRYTDGASMSHFYARVRESLEALPSVKSVGISTTIPLAANIWTRSFRVEGVQLDPGQPTPGCQFDVISPGYRQAVGIKLLRGRDFRELDHADNAMVVMVDDVTARHFWPDSNPIGQKIDLQEGGDDPNWRVVVGVVEHVKRSAFEVDASFQVYAPFDQMPMPTMRIVVHTVGDPLLATSQIQRAVAQLDPELPLDRIRTLEAIESAAIAQPKFNAMLLGVFSFVSIVLAALGIYGVQCFSVSQRTHEIGVRMALGAQAPDILRLVVGEGMKLSALGAGLGIVGALVGARVLASFLFRVSSVDPVIYAGVVIFLLCVALVACYIPARRATKIDPMVALRCD